MVVVVLKVILLISEGPLLEFLKVLNLDASA